VIEVKKMRTSNIEHRTSNIEVKSRLLHLLQCSMLNVRCSMFAFNFCLVISALISTGCGYQQTGVDNANNTPGYQWHSLYRQDIQTVAVPIFTNRTFRRGLENELTKSIIEQMEEHTPYKVVPKERADTILEGEIVSATTSTLSTDIQTGLPQEQMYTIVVSFTWKNLRTGDILVQRHHFDQLANYVPFLGESSSVGSTNSIQQLSLGIVQELQADW
jgi:Lipopolysaccharide-assembly